MDVARLGAIMNTREAIQSSREPVVLDVAFDESSTRFTCGLSTGIRAFRSNDCVRTLKESPPPIKKPVVLAASFGDRYCALVCSVTHSPEQYPHPQNEIQLWDNVKAEKIAHLDLAEPILGVRLCRKALIVILLERVVCLSFHQLPGDVSDTQIAPASVMAIHPTVPNPRAICSAKGNHMALPGLTPGQVQVIRFAQKSSRNIIRAHTSNIRQLDISADGQYLVTASEHGTLLRVFSISSLAQTHEFRRGVDEAIIYSISISPNNQFVATTSDKGTLHVFDLRSPGASKQHSHGTPRKTSLSRPSAASVSPGDFDAASVDSAPLPSRLAGALYGPPQDLAHVPPGSGPSALAALAKLPGMPRAFSDARSMSSAAYYVGSDPPSARAGYSASTPKGILAWDPDADDRRIWCVGGGTDARWEVFELVQGADEQGRKLKLVKAGFRNYLSRQFPAEQA